MYINSIYSIYTHPITREHTPTRTSVQITNKTYCLECSSNLRTRHDVAGQLNTHKW